MPRRSFFAAILAVVASFFLPKKAAAERILIVGPIRRMRITGKAERETVFTNKVVSVDTDGHGSPTKAHGTIQVARGVEFEEAYRELCRELKAWVPGLYMLDTDYDLVNREIHWRAALLSVPDPWKART